MIALVDDRAGAAGVIEVVAARRGSPCRRLTRVVAKRPPTSTEALGAKRTPFGLLRKTWPLEVRRPKISDGFVPSDAVQGDRGGARLDEVDPGARADGETVPVQDRACSSSGRSAACSGVTARCSRCRLRPGRLSAARWRCLRGTGLMNIHGRKAAPTAKAIMRGCVRSTRRVRAEARDIAALLAGTLRAGTDFLRCCHGPSPFKLNYIGGSNLVDASPPLVLKLEDPEIKSPVHPFQNHFTACTHTRRHAPLRRYPDCTSPCVFQAMFARTMKLPSWPAETPKPSPPIERLFSVSAGIGVSLIRAQPWS